MSVAAEKVPVDALVTPSWVAAHYGVPKIKVYRAIKAGRLKAYKVNGGSLVLNMMDLPAIFPHQ